MRKNLSLRKSLKKSPRRSPRKSPRKSLRKSPRKNPRKSPKRSLKRRRRRNLKKRKKKNPRRSKKKRRKRKNQRNQRLENPAGAKHIVVAQAINLSASQIRSLASMAAIRNARQDTRVPASSALLYALKISRTTLTIVKSQLDMTVVRVRLLNSLTQRSLVFSSIHSARRVTRLGAAAPATTSALMA